MKKTLAVLLTIMLVVGVMPMSIFTTTASAATSSGNTTDFLGGSGTEADPYLISNKTHLNNVRNYLNSNFKLMRDIEFTDADFAEGGAFYNSGKGFTPFGSSINEFTGTFDGNGFAVKKLYINTGTGLFYANSGTISNLGLVDGSISSSSYYTGGIVSTNNGRIINCYNTSKVDGGKNVGGIAGRNNSSGTIANCYNTGAVKAGEFHSTVYSGGIVGYNLGVVTNCYNTGKVNAVSVYDSYGSTSMIVAGGGIAGYSILNKISNCYNATTEVSATFHYAPGNNYIGNIIGYATNNNDVLSSCYFISDSSNAVGNGCLTADWEVELTSEQMKLKESFEGFSFDAVWDIEPDLDYPYPQLRSNRQYKITDVVVLTQPSNDFYAYGLFPDLTGAEIQVTYLAPDGQTFTKIRTVTNDMLYEFNRNMIGEQCVNVIYCGKSSTNTIDLKGIEKVVTAVKIISTPKKLNYILNQPLNTDGLSVEVECNNMFTYVEDISKMSINFDNTMVGTVPVSVSFQGCSDEFEITVDERKVKSITITEPTNLYNLQGSDIDLKNGKVHVVFVSDDDYSEDIPMDYSMISGYNKDLVGYQTVTVTYGEKTESFMIRVIDKKFTSISVVKYPKKMSYHIGDYPDYSGIIVEGSYSDLIFETIEDYSLTGFDSTSAGGKTITVSYGDLYDDFTITVEDHTYTKKYIDLQHWDECVICHNKMNYAEHIYDNTCDIHCNECDYTRTITHTYTANCDETCDICGYNRIALANHTYSNGCDTTCNNCDAVRTVTGHVYSNACDATCNECNSTREVPDHIYKNNCDTTCEECGATRTVTGHIYSNACDTSCNECGAIRTVSGHTYTNACDTTCNECGYVRNTQHTFANGVCNVCGLKQFPVAIRVTATSITLAPYTGYEYSKDGTTWQTSNVFTGLTASTAYKFYQRIAETADTNASASSTACNVTTSAKSACPISPAAPIVAETTTSKVVLVAREGYEYSKNGTTWQTSNSFTGLSSNTTYTFYQRIAETPGNLASSKSEGVSVKTLQASTGTCGYSTSYYYNKLRTYINNYGTTNSDGYKVVSFTYSDSDQDHYLYLTNNSSSTIRVLLHSEMGDVRNTCRTEFTLTSSPTYLTVKNSVNLFTTSGYNIITDSVSNTISLDCSKFTTSSKYTLSNSGRYLSASAVSDLFNSHIQLLCSMANLNIYKKLGFGLMGLGFSSYTSDGTEKNHGATEVRDAYSATCTTNGYTGNTYCTVCGEMVSKGSVINCVGQHTYTNSCDGTCNKCGEERVKEHSYSNDCDTSCNTCDAKRVVVHVYDSVCDETCNLCGATRKATHNFTDKNDLTCNDCGYERPPYTPGDLTGDDKINSLDGLMLLRHLNGWTLNIASPEAMDVNADGKVNSLDGLMLMRYLNGWNINLG